MIKTAAHLVGYNPRKDKSITIRFETGEKSPSEVMQIHSLIDHFGYVYFKPEEMLTDKELNELDSIDTDLYDNPKTQSQRLRNVLHVNWKHDDKGYKEFKDYYKSETDRIIDHYKSKLPEVG